MPRRGLNPASVMSRIIRKFPEHGGAETETVFTPEFARLFGSPQQEVIPIDS